LSGKKIFWKSRQDKRKHAEVELGVKQPKKRSSWSRAQGLAGVGVERIFWDGFAGKNRNTEFKKGFGPKDTQAGTGNKVQPGGKETVTPGKKTGSIKAFETRGNFSYIVLWPNWRSGDKRRGRGELCRKR